MLIKPQEFRDALSCFAAGVTLVTSKAGDLVHGLTVSAFSSISADPPIVAVCIDQVHTINPMLQEPEASFAVNVLAEDQEELSNRFAFGKNEDRFLVGDWTAATTGSPVLKDALTWLDCTVIDRHAVGTHTIYLGSVVACSAPRADTSPLVYWDRAYRKI